MQAVADLLIAFKDAPPWLFFSVGLLIVIFLMHRIAIELIRALRDKK